MCSSPGQRVAARGSAREHRNDACDKACDRHARAHHDRASFSRGLGAPLEGRGMNPGLAGVCGQANRPEDLGKRLLCLCVRVLC